MQIIGPFEESLSCLYRVFDHDALAGVQLLFKSEVFKELYRSYMYYSFSACSSLYSKTCVVFNEAFVHVGGRNLARKELRGFGF